MYATVEDQWFIIKKIIFFFLLNSSPYKNEVATIFTDDTDFDNEQKCATQATTTIKCAKK